MKRLRFIGIDTVLEEMYEGKFDDYGKPYTEELKVVKFEDVDENEIEISFSEDDLYILKELLK